MVKMSRRTGAKSKSVSERVRVRLGLRSSNAAQPHTNQARAVTRPGKHNRRAQQRRAIKEQEQ